MWRLYLAAITLSAIIQTAKSARDLAPSRDPNSFVAISLDRSHDLGAWEGWGSSLAWWGRAVGGTQNADYYADLIYTTRETDGLPGIGLNIVRYNVGGGGINQPRENKGPKLQWQMDISGYWTDPESKAPDQWSWSVDENQRTMMQKARDRGANVFELFSDSPMWWMNGNRSTAGSDTGGDCLRPEDYDRFAFYLAQVAKHSADHWGIKFDSVEPFNEPSANGWKYPGRQEGCHFDIATQEILAQRLRRALDTAGLSEVALAAADENNMDAGLNTWNAYSSATRAQVGLVNVHGYSNGTEPYHGPNRVALHQAAAGKRIWLSEYGDGDASGYTMAHAIMRDAKDLQPSAWIYWQPVEPDAPAFGWGLINANYVDTHDQPGVQKTTFVRANRKFFVFGQFTRYIRAGFHLIEISDPNAIAAYDSHSQKLVILKVTGDAPESIKIDVTNLSAADNIDVIATTTNPGGKVPDWKQHKQVLKLTKEAERSFIETSLHPKSVYTFVLPGVLP
jgi:galactan endo-1,6-beta-galactosidase